MEPEPGSIRTRAIALLRLPVARCWISTAKVPPHSPCPYSARRASHGERQDSGLLRLVRVRRPSIDLQLLQLLASELRLGKHAANRRLDEPLGILHREVLRPDRLQASGIAGVAVIDLVLALAPCQENLVRVGDADEVAAVQVGKVLGAVLAAQTAGNTGRQAAENLVGCVYHPPFLADRGAGSRRCP